MLQPARGEQRELLLGLDALGDHRQAERAPHVDHRAHHDPVARAAGDVLREPPVDLDRVERQRLEIGEARIARAEIVDRDAQAARAQLGEQVGCGGEVFHQPALGHLDGEPVAQPRSVGERQDAAGETGLGDVGRGDVDRDAQAASAPVQAAAMPIALRCTWLESSIR